MPESKPPPSSTALPPKHGSSGAFVGAAVVMLLLMGGLIYWKVASGPKEAPAPPRQASVEAPPLLESPPPPPPPPPVTPDAGKQQEAAKGKGGKWLGPTGCAGDCEGQATSALKSALGAKAGQARGCYERALRQNSMLAGKVVVSVRVGSKGEVCSAGVASNTTGDQGIASCVVGMFRNASFPAPNGGCVDVQVPMNFVPKT
jgi:outer membrane biosynthesis protein TonB